MVNYYIVSRNPNTNEYKSIMIGDSSVLENIDLYTLNFSSKEELIKLLDLVFEIVGEEV